ncbi:MAG: ATP-binding protein [Chloroflexi bacterium]|nr:ATP-binding protein [Chloroflexota bacterium]
MKVQADLENLSAIGEFVTRVMEDGGADPKSVFEVQLVVDEACTNIIQHAYSGGRGEIDIWCEMTGDDFIVTIKDQGKPFDPNSAPAPDLDADVEKRRVGGLGIFLMKRMMNEVTYRRMVENGNELTMRKRLTRSGKST